MDAKLYRDVLVWLHKQQDNLKFENELFEYFGELTESDYIAIFRDAGLTHVKYNSKENKHYVYLSHKGLAEVIELQRFEEMTKAAERAERTANRAIWIGVVVGSVQIVVGILGMMLGSP